MAERSFVDKKTLERLRSEWPDTLSPCNCGTPLIMEQDGPRHFHTDSCSLMVDSARRGYQTIGDARKVISLLLSEIKPDDEPCEDITQERIPESEDGKIVDEQRD